ncbi:hypothetical protein ABPG75_006439 [Micractinium tetrahymenae]
MAPHHLLRLFAAAALAALLATAAAAAPPPRLNNYPNRASAQAAARQLAAMSASDKRNLFWGWKRQYGRTYRDSSQEWDWTEHAMVPKIRPSQGDCGSCWGFSAIAAIESRALIEGTDKGPNLSEQQIVDCVTEAAGFRSQGCNGGYPEDAFSYVSSLYAVGERFYKYTGRNNSACSIPAILNKNDSVSLYPSPGFAAIDGDPDAIMAAVYNTGPVTAYFYVEESFLSYTSGIYPAGACRSNVVNHAMTIVGYSAAEGYWIVRNSWQVQGDLWGKGGYAWIEMTPAGTAGTCGMYAYPISAPLSTKPPPPSNTNTRFAWPQVYGASVDWCWGYCQEDWNPNQCGAYMARRWCWNKGYTGLADLEGPMAAPSGITRYQRYGTSIQCTGAGFCQSFPSITCGPKAAEPKPVAMDLFFDFDYPGGDLPGTPSSADTFWDCALLCAANVDCARWSWVPNFFGWVGACYLKGATGWYELDKEFGDYVSGVPQQGQYPIVVAREAATAQARCFNGQVISQILGASYAAGMPAATPTMAVAKLCLGQGRCVVQADNDLASCDPSPGTVKRLQFSYICSPVRKA